MLIRIDPAFGLQFDQDKLKSIVFYIISYLGNLLRTVGDSSKFSVLIRINLAFGLTHQVINQWDTVWKKLAKIWYIANKVGWLGQVGINA